LNSNGQLVFESHPPEIEPAEKLEQVIEQYFAIKEKPSVRMDGILDKDRTYIIANVK
jgi:hypothetical protein